MPGARPGFTVSHDLERTAPTRRRHGGRTCTRGQGTEAIMRSKRQDEKECVDRLKAGDDCMFGTLYARHTPSMILLATANAPDRSIDRRYRGTKRAAAERDWRRPLCQPPVDSLQSALAPLPPCASFGKDHECGGHRHWGIRMRRRSSSNSASPVTQPIGRWMPKAIGRTAQNLRMRRQMALQRTHGTVISARNGPRLAESRVCQPEEDVS